MKTDEPQTISAEEFERRFEAGDEVDDYIDWDNATRLNLETQRVNVDFPRWMLDALDAAAARLAIPRQSVIKMWIDERLKKEQKSHA